MDAVTQQILESGLLGALLVLSLFANAYQYREARKLEASHLEYMKDTLTNYALKHQEMTNLLNSIIEYVRAK